MKSLGVLTVALAVAVWSHALSAQTTVYEAPTGAVSPTLVITMHLTDGGTVTLDPVVGPNCYLGMTCGFPAGYVGTHLHYVLADGSSATLTDFSGTFVPLGGSTYEIRGRAAGVDDSGHSVRVDDVHAAMKITCRSGRGGGCTKKYAGGELTLTVDACDPCATMTPTATPLPPTPLPPTPTAGTTASCVGDCNGDGRVTVNELIACVGIALGDAPAATCSACDDGESGFVPVDRLVRAVGAALDPGECD